MIPAWIKRDRWVAGWLVDGAPAGGDERYVVVAYDDQPHPNWDYPKGSLKLERRTMENVRIRRTAIPVLPEEVKPDGD